MAMLVVGFEHTTTFVSSDDPDRLRTLNDAVQHGGEPVGLIGVVVDRGKFTMHVRALEEYEGKEWAQGYLSSLVEKVRELACSRHDP